MELAKGVELKVEGSKVVVALSAAKEGLGEAQIVAKLEIIAILEKFAASTENKVDDQMVAGFKAALGL